MALDPKIPVMPQFLLASNPDAIFAELQALASNDNVHASGTAAIFDGENCDRLPKEGQ